MENLRFIYYIKIVIVMAIISTLIASCSGDEAIPTPEDCLSTPSFASDIQPIINSSCALSGCHVQGFPNGDYTTYDGIKVKVDAGTFKTRVIENRTMPPEDSPGPTSLSAGQLEQIECWLDGGAPNN